MHLIRLPSPLDPEDVRFFKAQFPDASLRQEGNLTYAYFATQRHQARAMAWLCDLKYGVLQDQTGESSLDA